VDCARQGVACLCAGVSFAELDQAIADDRAHTVASLGDALGCGVQCGSCVPAIQEALGEVAWFPAIATARPITRARELQGLERLIYKVDIALRDQRPYPVVQPGQHVVLRATTDQGVVERTYTVVAQNIPARRLTVAVRRKPGGHFTPWLLQGVDGGTREIEVSIPGGPGLHSAGTRSVVFFAGGVGVTPAVAMVNALAPMATMHLDYSVTDTDDAAFLNKFDARRDDRSGFSYHVRQTSLEGPISKTEIRNLATRYRGSKFYICGPESYVDFIQRTLRKAGVDRARIHVELFALSPAKAPARSFRFKAYVAGAVLSIAPVFMLLPALDALRPHGHPNVGHEQLKCVACHAESPASTRQTLQAKVKHALGLRQTGAVMGMQAVTSTTCVQCHANSDDRHPPNRFLEPRFEQARADTGAQNCVSCHREHSAVRVTAPSAGYCVSCHQDMKVKDDKTSPTHDFLVRNKRWETCLQCHDYHGNHKWNAPLRLQDGHALEVLDQYMRGGPSPFGAPVVKSRQEKSL
jgi:ferredoxin-NADP reductase/bacterioferritin-associated ferredoxin/nitrate reductase cytochrome c-type subunit